MSMVKAMKAGDLKHKITLQTCTPTNNSNLEAIPTYSNFATVWAAIESISGKEYWESKTVTAETVVRIRIRYIPGVLPTMRIVYGSRIFHIDAILHLHEQKREIHLMCREVLAG
jgi:SPP1 family predicted phage head-tail adaptor